MTNHAQVQAGHRGMQKPSHTTKIETLAWDDTSKLLYNQLIFTNCRKKRPIGHLELEEVEADLTRCSLSTTE